ncbi:MAG: hypothetical protein JJT89_04535 [Nitriliruptoraceae bacterium]|nr:hypothetical protein [Nitriliruptoraceae bacterium]
MHRSLIDPIRPARAGARSHGALRSFALLLALVVAVSACTDPEPGSEATAPAVRIASGPDPETALLAHTMRALMQRAGFDGDIVAFTDARDARRALEQGAVDVRPAYSGEAWLETLGRPDPPSDPETSVREVAEEDDAAGIEWLLPPFDDAVDTPPANATFAFVVPMEESDELSTVSQLATRLAEEPEATLCVDEEFAARPDGLRAVLTAYSVRSDQPVLAAAPADAVLGVAAGDCLAGLTTATDGAAWAAQLRPLVDDLRVFPAFVALPQLRASVDGARPEIRRALTPLSDELTTTLLAAANARIVGGEPLEQVGDELAVELLTRAGRPLETETGS